MSSEEKFDAIVVGGGLAGSAAALTMAKAGLDVMLIERGKFCGSKNSSGGRIYGHSLERLIPNFAEEAPIERKITQERLSLMTEGGALSFQYNSDKLQNLKYPSYSVLRSKFDKWMAEKAEEAGVMLLEGFRVDQVLVDESGKATGVVCGDEEFDADVIVLADGVNSLLAQQLGMKQELDPKDVAVGVKEVIYLGEDVINERFGLQGDEGAAWMIAGDPTGGNLGGGFIYTNKDSLSLGIVTTISDIGRVDVSVPDMVERMKNHPSIAPFVKGGKLTEYSAHLVTEGGLKMMPELVRDGVIVAGDAAAMVVNLGYTVRGMDLAIESGRLAGEAVVRAKAREDFSAESLSYYKKLLDESFIMKLMKQYQNLPGLLEDHIIFNDVPKMADEFAGMVYKVDGGAPVALPMIALTVLANNGGLNGLFDLGKKAWEAM
ncbi:MULTISPECIES: FAD-dependent oxidoreductase [Megasphaera]|jgi:electron transfer flavoprotein-quinone oxidoreductase|uniref:FAD-dependent oxidoreductase n=1 Tax=Megasphaera TaxID=906 RepID=UPI000B3BBC00|nr:MULTISPECIES: FAD-dependent oxidoreductase [Megasphaera]MDN0047652.1 FAD-dependent oxidoreductase [Megasphaera hexanoica]NJE34835.1 FAD-dependent oxidoreductase [Megasphaera sp. SW808]OUO45451.1 FAD-dependent oxidoreductase [Megasphaera sp. An286]